ncbi:TetR/AcrR family transcriptional regulator [Vibrio alginolyticus]|uniref:TetR/AcrR family transcriptional regulator n=1 Tax=Vibrio TaxID=662 RepID=UPI00029A6A89|nr:MULTISPECIES: TetR/AcrR family transcriptional regulator [Vibrio]ELB2812608.1 TetR/AcrR family transcriptional regulator [Vibrio alginolyticus]MDA0408860.1 TetR/AcrR family transcriptional regulator [Vibrio alginolyticus]OEE24262.1 TetR family transcriptional regulator [Vibrio cyclitrophicus ZF14]
MSKRAQFDREDVIIRAKNLYWAKGYHGTSMRALQDAIDMRPGSIYATFGSKDNLFILAIERYGQESNQLLESCLVEAPTKVDGLKSFIRKIILERRGTAPSGMCMIIKSISELTEEDNPDLLATAKRLLNDIEKAFTVLLTSAIDDGEISANKDPVELARYVQVQIIGLRTFARATEELDAVEKFIDDIFVSGPFK